MPYTTQNGGQWGKLAEDAKDIIMRIRTFTTTVQMGSDKFGRCRGNSIYVWSEDPGGFYRSSGFALRG